MSKYSQNSSTNTHWTRERTCRKDIKYFSSHFIRTENELQLYFYSPPLPKSCTMNRSVKKWSSILASLFVHFFKAFVFICVKICCMYSEHLRSGHSYYYCIDSFRSNKEQSDSKHENSKIRWRVIKEDAWHRCNMCVITNMHTCVQKHVTYAMHKDWTQRDTEKKVSQSKRDKKHHQ